MKQKNIERVDSFESLEDNAFCYKVQTLRTEAKWP